MPICLAVIIPELSLNRLAWFLLSGDFAASMTVHLTDSLAHSMLPHCLDKAGMPRSEQLGIDRNRHSLASR